VDDDDESLCVLYAAAAPPPPSSSLPAAACLVLRMKVFEFPRVNVLARDGKLVSRARERESERCWSPEEWWMREREREGREIPGSTERERERLQQQYTKLPTTL